MENDLECVALDNQSQKLNKTIRKNKLQIKIMAIVLSVLFIFITAFVVLGMIAESVYFYTGVEGSSMKPTINASAQDSKQAYDHVYVNTYQKGTYNDIIVIEHTGRGGDVKKVIKRLIAMGGDTVKIDNSDSSRTRVYVNDVLLDEDYLDLTRNSTFRGFSSGQTTLTVPEGYIFYMGDNRNGSDDCRAYYYTEVPFCEKVSNIVGRVDYIVPYENLENGDGKNSERFWNGMREVFFSIF